MRFRLQRRRCGRREHDDDAEQQRGQQHGPGDGDVEQPRPGDAGVEQPYLESSAGGQREARLQDLRQQQESEPRHTGSQHDGGQGLDVSLYFIYYFYNYLR